MGGYDGEEPSQERQFATVVIAALLRHSTRLRSPVSHSRLFLSARVSPRLAPLPRFHPHFVRRRYERETRDRHAEASGVSLGPSPPVPFRSLGSRRLSFLLPAVPFGHVTNGTGVTWGPPGVSRVPSFISRLVPSPVFHSGTLLLAWRLSPKSRKERGMLDLP